MIAYYKPTENIMLKHYHFQFNMQKDRETFIAFCNHILLEARHWDFKCTEVDCTAEDIAVRDQIIIGLKGNDVCQEALKRDWYILGNTKTRRHENRKCS